MGAGGHFNCSVVQIALNPRPGPQRDLPARVDVAAHGAMQLHHLCHNRAVDYRDGLEGAQCVIRNPNATRTCGCGS